MSSDFVSFLTIGILLGGILILCAWVIKRVFIDKRWFNTSSRFMGMHIYSQWQNADKQANIEHVHYMEEDEKEEESKDEQE